MLGIFLRGVITGPISLCTVLADQAGGLIISTIINYKLTIHFQGKRVWFGTYTNTLSLLTLSLITKWTETLALIAVALENKMMGCICNVIRIGICIWLTRYMLPLRTGIIPNLFFFVSSLNGSLDACEVRVLFLHRISWPSTK